MLLWQSILAGLQVVAGSSVLLELLEARWVGLFSLMVAGAQVATTFYLRGLSLPAPGPGEPSD